MATPSRVLFLGSKRLGLEALRTLVALRPDLLVGVVTIDDQSDSRSVLDEFKRFARENSLPLFVSENRSAADDLIEELRPDLCLVVGWYWLIGERQLRSVSHGFVGLHYSRLPLYRGSSPAIWPIIRGEREVGFSIFSFTPGMDDGPLWRQGAVEVAEADYISDVLQKLEVAALAALVDVYPLILEGTTLPTEQDHALATYCSQRLPEDGAIDWRRSAKEVYDFIRAQSDPYPGAFSFLGVDELRVWRASRFGPPYFGTPGQVARIAREGVYVVCGDDRALILEEVELAGVRGRAEDLIRSIKGRFSRTPRPPR